MNGTGTAPNAPQFHTNEVPGTQTCKFCGMAIGGQYYRVGQHMACGACAEKVRQLGPQNPHGAFVRAVVFGVAAAIAGLVIYAVFEIMTGWIIGYISLLVGFMVGKAMMAGSGGWGGRRYQVVAALLTYAAVSLAAIPVAISYQAKHASGTTQHVRQVPQSTAPSAEPAGPSNATDATETQPAAPEPKKMSAGAAIGALAMLGLASPFLELTGDPFHGVIGLIILFVGIRIAWQTAGGKRVATVSGPY